MHDRELPLTLLVLVFISISESCQVFGVLGIEDKRFTGMGSVKRVHTNETTTIRWYESSKSRGCVELNPSSSPRITLHNYILEFWPAELDDWGSYFFQMGNDTQEWKLNVIRRNKHSCFTKKLVISRRVEVKRSLQMTCNNSYCQKLVNRTSLYK
ncbi:PREDICTED: interleukin-18 receptor 1-like, partial [Galeopterus variegatus]|uniref:Interleukin-18 receptor 1-like n=1 Tax=Galeopterus variegatus TaxID=482537 RepID=A0ABM0Q2G3_GALVR